MQLNIPELDLSRQALVEILNRMYSSLHGQCDADTLAAMLRRFVHVARDYTSLERRYLMLHENEDTLHNTREDNIQQIQCDVIDGLYNYLEKKYPVNEDLLLKLKTWLLTHFEMSEVLKSQPGRELHPAQTIA